jgi:hypothetical protein
MAGIFLVLEEVTQLYSGMGNTKSKQFCSSLWLAQFDDLTTGPLARCPIALSGHRMPSGTSGTGTFVGLFATVKQTQGKKQLTLKLRPLRLCAPFSCALYAEQKLAPSREN